MDTHSHMEAALVCNATDVDKLQVKSHLGPVTKLAPWPLGCSAWFYNHSEL